MRFPSSTLATASGDTDRLPVYRTPVPLWDAVQRSFDAGEQINRTGARVEAMIDEQNKRRLDIERRTGVRLPKPFSEMGGIMASDPMLALGQRSLDSGYATDAQFEALVEDLRRTRPQAMAGVETDAQLRARLDARLDAIAARAAEGAEDHPIAAFLGGVAGSFTDPINVATMGGAGATSVGRPLLQRMMIQAATNAGIEASLTPVRMGEAEAIGGPQVTLGDAAINVAAAGAAGAGFEAAGHGIGLGVRAAAKRFGARALEDPAVRGVATAADGLERDLAAVGEDRPGNELDEALSALREGRPAPAPLPDRDLAEMFAGPGVVDYKGRPIASARFEPSQLEVAPKTFQYKADGDAAGVTARLRGVEAWDPVASGKVIVWEAQDGRRVIADGHQRLGLAKRLDVEGFEAQLDGYLFREADGWSAREVRVVAALKNIREGSGTILDAAKVFRDAPETLADRSLPVSGEFIAQARGLAKLSPEAFGAVVNKVIPERQAAEIGLLAPSRPDLHDGMVRLLKEGKPESLDEARALVAEALQDDWIKTEGETGDLFGYDPSVSAMIARAKVAAGVTAAFRREARLFAGLVKHADAIEAGGNALARDANEAAVALDRAALEVTSKLALRSGPLGEAMAEAAARVTRGEPASTAVRGVVTRIRGMIERGEQLDAARGMTIDPEPPTPAAREAAAAFDDPAGPGVREQLQAKPEEADLELSPEEMGGGLFDDMPQVGAERAAHTRLLPCAPGVG